jgi:hypothetical protein
MHPLATHLEILEGEVGMEEEVAQQEVTQMHDATHDVNVVEDDAKNVFVLNLNKKSSVFAA